MKMINHFNHRAKNLSLTYSPSIELIETNGFSIVVINFWAKNISSRQVSQNRFTTVREYRKILINHIRNWISGYTWVQKSNLNIMHQNNWVLFHQMRLRSVAFTHYLVYRTPWNFIPGGSTRWTEHAHIW